MEEILFSEWNEFTFSYAVVNPLWSNDVKIGLLDDSFDVECCLSPVREIHSVSRDLRVVFPLYTTSSDSWLVAN